MAKNLIIASTSTLHGDGYLEYLTDEIVHLFRHCDRIVFIPYARPGGMSHQDYTEKVKLAFSKTNKKIFGLHEFDDPAKAVAEAQGIFTGGGNTFLLVSQLYRFKVMEVLTDVVKNGTPYLGSSAGSNITGLTMQTTNDMPIVYPPSFKTLGIVPFNLNPHYQDADAQSKHMGETREMRIQEYHQFNTAPVLGLREGSWLDVSGNKIILKGDLTARLFRANKAPEELASGSDLGWIN